MKVFSNINIGFDGTSLDDGNLRLLLAAHKSSIEGRPMHGQSACLECIDWIKHEEKCKIARKAYQNDHNSEMKNPNVIVADM